MFALLAASMSLLASNPFVDSDHDGIPDIAKTTGFGPIDPKKYDLHPGRADLFIVFRRRSDLTMKTLQPVIDRMKRFYAEMPHKNRDGSTGIHMIPILPPPMPVDTDKKSYQELYELGMPKEWRGLAHGILLDNNGGGGGQCDRDDWAGASYNWHTVVHEIGHEFGLPHEPLGAQTQSPFHDSLMNYDYTYQFDGDGERIHFSTGKFIPMTMAGTDLDEVVPVGLKDLEFLTRWPYNFKMKALGPDKTAIDWNRNGIFGEHHVKANINDGYAIGYEDLLKLGKTAGAPALASFGNDLVVVYPSFAKDEEYKDYELGTPSKEKPAPLCLQLVRAGKGLTPQTLWPQVCGDPSALSDHGMLYIAAPTPTGYRAASYRLSGTSFSEISHRDVSANPVTPTLVSTPYGVKLVTWDSASHAVTLEDFDGKNVQALQGYEPQTGVGAVWNPLTQRLSLVAGVKQDKADLRVQIQDLVWSGGKWSLGPVIWVEGEKGGARTSARPNVIFDAGKDRGPHGGYDVFVRASNNPPGSTGLHFYCRQIEDKSMSDGWRTKMMGNEWAWSRSMSAVTPYRGDFAYAVRWFGNELFVFQRASGIDSNKMTDFDEVGFIFDHGLHNSLRNVQNREWKPTNG